jgi:transcriptional regulator with XRE-family HTH domain
MAYYQSALTGTQTATIRLPQGVTTGDRLRIARAAVGLSGKEMARALGVSLKTYERIERGERELRLSELHALAAATGQDPEFFGATSLEDPAPSLPLLPGAVKQEDAA